MPHHDNIMTRARMKELGITPGHSTSYTPYPDEEPDYIEDGHGEGKHQRASGARWLPSTVKVVEKPKPVEKSPCEEERRNHHHRNHPPKETRKHGHGHESSETEPTVQAVVKSRHIDGKPRAATDDAVRLKYADRPKAVQRSTHAVLQPRPAVEPAVRSKPPYLRFIRGPQPYKSIPRSRWASSLDSRHQMQTQGQRRPDQSSKFMRMQSCCRRDKTSGIADFANELELGNSQMAMGGFGSLHRFVKPSTEKGYGLQVWAATGSLPRAPPVSDPTDTTRLREEATVRKMSYNGIGPERELIIYPDGACWRNGYKHATAAIGVYFGKGHPLNVSAVVPIGHRQTNNTAEILAATKAVEQARLTGLRRICLVTDSSLLVNGWRNVPVWEKTGWKTTAGKLVKNKREFKKLIHAVSLIPGGTLRMILVKGHGANEGNNAADALAAAAIHRYVEELNQKLWDVNPTARPIRMFRSKYGDPPDELISSSVRRRIRGNLRNKVLHQAVEEAERNSILERMKKNPALAAEAKRLARNVTQEIEARKHQSEGVSSENFPKQMIKDPQSSSSDTHLISLVQEVKPTESRKLGNGRVPKAILEQERKKMEASLLTIQVGDMRRHLLKRRIDEELAKAERLRTRNQRKNQAKRL